MKHIILWDLGKMRKGKHLLVSRPVLLGTNENKNHKQPCMGPEASPGCRDSEAICISHPSSTHQFQTCYKAHFLP